VKLDVSVYSPAELNVTISEDRLVIKGKHEQKADNHAYVNKTFQKAL
jgi:HSP20 family molecular chaperone IbpA